MLLNEDLNVVGARENPPNRLSGTDSTHTSGVSPTPSIAMLAKEVLFIVRSRDGEVGEYSTSEYGNIRIPNGWVFLPRGDAFITRQVKKGPHWVLKGTYNRKGGYTRIKGVFAPAETIKTAQAAAEATKVRRKIAREKARPRREKAEQQYRHDFEEACLCFLDFAPAYSELAREIAAETASLACEKHSGRVGRTGLIDLAAKAAFAVRAYIRHN